jgi:4'-phosphopantetheinyl transferase EntD
MQIAVIHQDTIAAEPALLSPAERLALAAVCGERRRDEWIRGRLAIRRVLGDRDTSVLVAPDGAPEPIGGAPCNVSLSHDGAWIAVAVADRPVGIDVCARMHAARVARILRWLGVRGEVDGLAGWSALEAVLKLRRWSIEMLRDRDLELAATGTEVVVRGLDDAVVAQVRNEADYVVAWATE